jgi:WhiB family redox-sensing transcriptional regulator
MDWRSRAACRQVDTSVFFPASEDKSASAQAKEVCSRCAVQADCREFALSTRQRNGVWGGLTLRERQRELRRRATARAA